MLRLAALAIPVAYQAISLRNCSDGCASRRPSRKRQSGLPARLSAGVGVLTEKMHTLPSSRPCIPCLTPKYPRQAGMGLFCRDAASGSTCGSGRPSASAVQACCEIAVLYLPVCARQSPCFSQNRGFVKGAQPLYDLIWRFFRHLTPKLPAGPRRQKNRPKISPLPGE